MKRIGDFSWWWLAAAAAGLAMAGILAWVAALEIADLRKEKALKADLERLQPSMSGADAVLHEREEAKRAAMEFKGWREARTALGVPLQKVVAARPMSMVWNRLVVQSHLFEGDINAEHPFRPRFRSCRLVINGRITGRLSGPTMQVFVETLDGPDLLGGRFQPVRYRGLQRGHTTDAAAGVYGFTLEAHALPRAIDRAQTP